PTRLRASRTVTSAPARDSSYAAARPAKPAPITTTRGADGRGAPNESRSLRRSAAADASDRRIISRRSIGSPKRECSRAYRDRINYQLPTSNSQRIPNPQHPKLELPTPPNRQSPSQYWALGVGRSLGVGRWAVGN